MCRSRGDGIKGLDFFFPTTFPLSLSVPVSLTEYMQRPFEWSIQKIRSSVKEFFWPFSWLSALLSCLHRWFRIEFNLKIPLLNFFKQNFLILNSGIAQEIRPEYIRRRILPLLSPQQYRCSGLQECFSSSCRYWILSTAKCWIAALCIGSWSDHLTTTGQRHWSVGRWNGKSQKWTYSNCSP